VPPLDASRVAGVAALGVGLVPLEQYFH